MDIPKILNTLDKEIDYLVDKYGMTDRLESVNEDWTNLMHAYYTDYRGSEDDDDIKQAILEIHHDLLSIRRYNELPLADRMNHLSLNKRIAVSGANAVRYNDFIVLTGKLHELEDIQKRFHEAYGVKGQFRDYRRNGGPVGLMYVQHNGRNLYEFGVVDRDMSDKGLGKKRKRDDRGNETVTKKQSRSKSYDFYIEDGHFCIVGDSVRIKDRLGDLLIPYFMDGDVVKVGLEYNTLLVQNDILNKIITKPTKPQPVIPKKAPAFGRFKLYQFNGRNLILGKRKYIVKLRDKLGMEKKAVRGNENAADLVLVNDDVSKLLKLKIKGTEETLPEKYIPLLYHLYPSMKHSRDDLVFSLDDVMDDSEPWIMFTEHNDITDFHEFRGTGQYQYPWIVDMKARTSNVDTFEFLDNVNWSGAIYHIAVKRQSKWTKYMRSALEPINDKILSTPAFSDRLMSAIAVGTEYMYTFLIHEFSRDSRHANALVFDIKNQRVIRFEPHGSYSGCYDQQVCDQYIRDAIGQHPLLKNYTYIGPRDYEHYAGPQTIEVHHQTKYETVTKQFGSKTRVIQAGGFCMAWSILFIHMSFLNFKRTPESVYSHFFTGTANELADYIRIFQSYLVKMSKKYYGDKYKRPYR